MYALTHDILVLPPQNHMRTLPTLPDIMELGSKHECGRSKCRIHPIHFLDIRRRRTIRDHDLASQLQCRSNFVQL